MPLPDFLLAAVDDCKWSTLLDEVLPEGVNKLDGVVLGLAEPPVLGTNDEALEGLRAASDGIAGTTSDVVVAGGDE